MITKEALEYEEDVIASAKDWLNGKAPINNQMELAIIADHYGVKLPACIHYFRYSDNPNDICATGAFKTIYKTIDKLAKAIKAVEVRPKTK